jgi:hypothetical protein
MGYPHAANDRNPNAFHQQFQNAPKQNKKFHQAAGGFGGNQQFFQKGGPGNNPHFQNKGTFKKRN